MNKPIHWLTNAIQQQTHSSWHKILTHACKKLSPDYLNFLSDHPWLPGKEKIFNAFKLPFANMRFILYGESPYPRTDSANGFAFWDAAVGDIWSAQGLSKAVNRATSLRNLLKMLLTVEEEKNMDSRIQTLDELFQNFLSHGFLLLNFNLSLSELNKNKEAAYWIPFHESLLKQIAEEKTHANEALPELILLGKIAERVLNIRSSQAYQSFTAEHPYNLSFIDNEKVRSFFKSLKLLRKRNIA